jgi:CBS-domain-containing membrane protein
MQNDLTKQSTSHRVLFNFFGCAISIAIMSIVALFTHSPFVFPSLGPTAFLFFSTPNAPAASPRNTIIGHAIGILAGYLSLVVTGLTNAGPTSSIGVSWPRVIAAALSLGLTGAFMLLLNASHPPAGATTLIISLGIQTKPLNLGVLMIAIVFITLLTILIHRLARVPYPLWSPTTLDMRNKA